MMVVDRDAWRGNFENAIINSIECMKRKIFLEIVDISWVVQTWVLKTILLGNGACETQLSLYKMRSDDLILFYSQRSILTHLVNL